MGNFTTGVLLPQKTSNYRATVYHHLDPLTQRALGVLRLPTVHTTNTLHDAVAASADRYLTVFCQEGFSAADAARRMNAYTGKADINIAHATLLLERQLLRNHANFDQYCCGGADYDCYR
jgi:hypothetical protein